MSLRILCDAIPFCYGPGAALLTLLDAVSAASPCSLTFDVLATGSTKELVERASSAFRLLPVDSENPLDLEAVPFDAYDAFINVCNPVSFLAAQREGIPVSYVDFLLWMHTGPRAAHFDAGIYLAEDYPGTREWVSNRGREIPNLCVVPPLVTPVQRAPSRPWLVIGLGGQFSRLTKPGLNTAYPTLVVSALLDAVPAGRFDRIVIAGPARCRGALDGVIAGHPGAEYVSLSHQEFLDLLSRAELFVSHPGLYAPFEAMLGEVPTAFLPPSNYTQVLQLRRFRELGLASFSFDWEDVGLSAIPFGLSEEDGVRAVLASIVEAERSPEILVRLRNTFSAFFSMPRAACEEMANRQRAGASSFGLFGPEIAAERFLAWLGSAPPRGRG